MAPRRRYLGRRQQQMLDWFRERPHVEHSIDRLAGYYYARIRGMPRPQGWLPSFRVFMHKLAKDVAEAGLGKLEMTAPLPQLSRWRYTPPNEAKE